MWVKYNTMFIVSFDQICAVPPARVSEPRLQEILSACENLIRVVPEQELGHTIQAWSTALIWQSVLPQGLDGAWYDRALFVTCLRGLRGESAPDFWVETDDDTK